MLSRINRRHRREGTVRKQAIARSIGFVTEPLERRMMLSGGGLIYVVNLNAGTIGQHTTVVIAAVSSAPQVTTNPASQIVTVGNTVTFTAAATGTPTPSVGWQVSTDGGKTFTNIPGANSDTYSFTATAGENGNEYKAFFNNSQGTAVTATALLTVPPVVTTNPTNQNVTVGETVTFTAAATGTPTPTVGWQVSTNGGKTFANIPGANSDTYSFTATAGENGNEYRAFFSHSHVSVLTSAALLTVSPGSQSSRISGVVYYDKDDSGVKHHNDPGLANVTVTLQQLTRQGHADYPPQTVQTDANGNYAFTNLAATHYRISQTVPAGDTITEPSTGSYTFNLTPGQILTGEDFGDRKNV